MPAEAASSGLFILPNFTIVVQLVLFLVTLAVMWRFVVPPIQRSMAERADRVARQLAEAEAAREGMAEAERAYREAAAATRAEATRIREDARAEGTRALAAVRVEAQSDVDRVRAAGAERLAAERETVLLGLRDEVGRLAVELAGRVVGEPLAGAETGATVERYLAGMTAGVQAATALEEPGS